MCSVGKLKACCLTLHTSPVNTKPALKQTAHPIPDPIHLRRRGNRQQSCSHAHKLSPGLARNLPNVPSAALSQREAGRAGRGQRLRMVPCVAPLLCASELHLTSRGVEQHVAAVELHDAVLQRALPLALGARHLLELRHHHVVVAAAARERYYQCCRQCCYTVFLACSSPGATNKDQSCHRWHSRKSLLKSIPSLSLRPKLQTTA